MRGWVKKIIKNSLRQKDAIEQIRFSWTLDLYIFFYRTVVDFRGGSGSPTNVGIFFINLKLKIVYKYSILQVTFSYFLLCGLWKIL